MGDLEVQAVVEVTTHRPVEVLLHVPVGDGRSGGQFLTQPLRGVSLTGPYMHAGQLATLADVIEFYRRGGDREGYAGVRDPRIQPLEIDDEEARALEAFLISLTRRETP